MFRFAVDWIVGSEVVNILLNSKASKMATITLPKYYPFSGTSRIKLINLTGYEDTVVKQFTVKFLFYSLIIEYNTF